MIGPAVGYHLKKWQFDTAADYLIVKPYAEHTEAEVVRALAKVYGNRNVVQPHHRTIISAALKGLGI